MRSVFNIDSQFAHGHIFLDFYPEVCYNRVRDIYDTIVAFYFANSYTNKSIAILRDKLSV